MTHAIAVIGANFGDEGKGLAVDHFVRRVKSPLVARCNGGAQAGHTVVAGENHHVFGHVAAGTFAGASTYLSSAFIINPPVLTREIAKLDVFPQVFAHPDCRVTTIYDVAINSLAELAREDRHGSCGLGINETVTRHAAGFFLTLANIKTNSLTIRHITERIRDEWVPQRMIALGLSRKSFANKSEAVNQRAAIYFDALFTDPDKVAADLINNSIHIIMTDVKQEIGFNDTVVIEGAQGLMLDEFLGEFPHVTRSVTGLASSVRAAAECGKLTITPVYITRSYLTRHGAGALPYEGEEITDGQLHDLTNVTNPWQGTLRYSPLDVKAMKKFIDADILRGELTAQLYGVTVKPAQLFVTCMDQLGDFVAVMNLEGVLEKMTPEHLPFYLGDALGLDVYASSHGPSNNCVLYRKAVV